MRERSKEEPGEPSGPQPDPKGSPPGMSIPEGALGVGGASVPPKGGHTPESSPRAGQKPLSSTMAASNCHTALGCSAGSRRTVPCTANFSLCHPYMKGRAGFFE